MDHLFPFCFGFKPYDHHRSANLFVDEIFTGKKLLKVIHRQRFWNLTTGFLYIKNRGFWTINVDLDQPNF